MTNVPGPQFPLYFMGGQLVEAYPYVGLMGTLSVSVAAVSYNGHIHFGLGGDWDAVPDLAVIAEGIGIALEELLDS